MATFRKRGNRWQAQIRRQGHNPLSRTFTFKADAEAWARQREAELERGEPTQDTTKAQGVTLGSLLDRYVSEVSTKKKGCGPEVIRLKAMRRNAIADITTDRLTTTRLASFRDERLRMVTSGTVRRELAVLRHCLELARKEWSVALPINPFDDLGLPSPSKPRERRVTKLELQNLATALKAFRNPLVANIVRFAVATGMRRGEILAFTWGDVSLPKRVVRLQDTKNGSPRSVPLSPMALGVLQGLTKGNAADLVFPMTANAVRLSWERLKRRAGIVDLRFHDLRHEAISRFFEAGLSVPEVSLISGHKDPRMLFRYTHIRPETVAARLDHLTTTEDSYVEQTDNVYRRH